MATGITHTENIWMCDFFKFTSDQTNKQTDRQADRHAGRNTYSKYMYKSYQLQKMKKNLVACASTTRR